MSEPSSGPAEIDDLFALGTVLYEICTGQKLYEGKSDVDIITLLRRHEYPDVKFIIPSEVGTIIENCWAERYTTAGDVLRDLRKMAIFPLCKFLLIHYRSSPLYTLYLVSVFQIPFR